MPTTPSASGKEPAEGSRETAEFELSRAQGEKKAQATASPRAPGDDAAPGTPGTGEDVCPECEGNGKVQGRPCANCAGTGRVVKAIGGA